MKPFLPRALIVVLIFGILTMWVKALWPLALFQVGVFSLTAICLLSRVRRSQALRRSILFVPLGMTAAWPMLQLALHRTAYVWETQAAILRWSTMLAVFALALQIFEEPTVRYWFSKTLLGFGCILAILSMLQLFSSPGRVFWIFPTDYTGFVLGPFVYKNQYAAFVEPLLPLALVAAFHAGESSLMRTGMAAVLYASVIAANSRMGAVLVSTEVLVIFAWTVRKQQLGRQFRLRLAGMIVLVGVLSTAVGWGALWDRFHQADPFQVRRQLLYSSVDMIRQHPWIGFGLGTWPTVYPAHAYFDDGLFVNQAHNDWAQWTAEGGLPFAAMLFWVFLWSGSSVRKAPWAIGVIAIFLHALVDYPFEKQPLSALCFVMVGMIAASQNITSAGEITSQHPVNGMYTDPVH